MTDVITPDSVTTAEGETIYPAGKIFNVAWILNGIEAQSPEEAALRARAIQTDPDFSATVFLVYTQDGMQKTVDIASVIRMVDEISADDEPSL